MSRKFVNRLGLGGGALVVIAAMLALAPASRASLVKYDLSGFTSGGLSIAIHTTTTEASQVGQFILTTYDPAFPSPLLGYCTDVAVPLQSQFFYNPTTLASANGVGNTWITGGGVNAATLWYNEKDAATTAVQTAGLQLAIWELLYNAPAKSYSASTFTSHSNAGFYVASSSMDTAAAENYAASVLNNFNNLTMPTGAVLWLAPTEADGTVGGSQGLFEVAPPAAVPEITSTAGFFALGLLGLSLVRNRFFTKVSNTTAPTAHSS